jgi:hypothetical protein
VRGPLRDSERCGSGPRHFRCCRNLAPSGEAPSSQPSPRARGEGGVGQTIGDPPCDAPAVLRRLKIMAPLCAAELQAAPALRRRSHEMFRARAGFRAAIAAAPRPAAGDRRRPAPHSARHPRRMDGAPHRDPGLGVVAFRLKFFRDVHRAPRAARQARDDRIKTNPQSYPQTCAPFVQ